MPPQGHKTITIRQEDYNYFYEQYTKNQETLARKGVRSFSAFVTMKLYQSFEQKE